MSTFLFSFGTVIIYFIGELFLDSLSKKSTGNKLKLAKAKKKK